MSRARLGALALVTACSTAAPEPAPAPETSEVFPRASEVFARDKLAASAEASEAFRRDIATIVAPRGSSVVVGLDGFLFFAPELRGVATGRFWGADAIAASTAPRPEDRDPLPAILDFARQLRERGIDLLVVPVPAKVLVYPDRLRADLPSPLPRLDQAYREFLTLLGRNGVSTLDLLPDLIAERDSPVFCRQDSHWTGRGLGLAAARIAERTRAMAWYEAVPKMSFTSEEREVAIEGDLWRDLPEPRPERERLNLRFVGTPVDGALVPPPIERHSPVLLLGDSHALVFHAGADLHARGAGLPDALALELGFPIDLVGVRGSGATPARLSLRRRGGLAAKKLVVWCFSVREFTTGQGWKLVPLDDDQP